ncbi:MAG: hypothetical protein RL670_828 [Actinomycetota bacterium]
MHTLELVLGWHNEPVHLNPPNGNSLPEGQITPESTQNREPKGGVSVTIA